MMERGKEGDMQQPNCPARTGEERLWVLPHENRETAKDDKGKMQGQAMG